jgi:hypothetical protein
MSATLLILLALQASASVVLENEYVRVTRNQAPCAPAASPDCGDRVLVAMGDIELPGPVPRWMTRGDIAVFEAGRAYAPPVGEFLEVTWRPAYPPVQSPSEIIAPEKNSLLYDGARFFVFEEKLDPGDTRPRHSHSQRVVIVINATRLQQWPEGQPELFREQIPDDVRFNPPVIHVVKTVGDRPLRNIVIELKPPAARRDE